MVTNTIMDKVMTFFFIVLWHMSCGLWYFVCLVSIGFCCITLARNPAKFRTSPDRAAPPPKSCRPTGPAKLPLFSLFFLISSSLPFSTSAPPSLSNPSLDPPHIDLAASTHPQPRRRCPLWFFYFLFIVK